MMMKPVLLLTAIKLLIKKYRLTVLRLAEKYTVAQYEKGV